MTDRRSQSLTAMRIADVMRESIAYDVEARSWYARARGKHIWRIADRSEIIGLIIDPMLDLNPRGHSYSYLNGMVSILSSMMPAPAWDDDCGYVPAANGVIEASTGRLLPHDDSRRYRWQLPYAFDPTAECPMTAEWLSWIASGKSVEVSRILAWMRAMIVGGHGARRTVEVSGLISYRSEALLILFSALVGKANTRKIQQRHLKSWIRSPGLRAARLIHVTDVRDIWKSVDSITAAMESAVVAYDSEGAWRSVSQSRLPRGIIELDNGEISDMYRFNYDYEMGMHAEVAGLLNWVLSVTNDEMMRLI